MSQSARDTLFCLLRACLSSDFSVVPTLTDEQRLALYRLAVGQDVGHLVAYALQESGQTAEDIVGQRLNQKLMSAVLRYEQSEHELSAVCRVLAAAGIRHMPLKGAVLRQHYPEPWMRTSADLDILVQEDDLARAKELLANELHYRCADIGAHDASLFSPGGVHVELHYTVPVEQEVLGDAFAVLRELWQTAQPIEGQPYRFAMSPEMYTFYHVAHMAKHMLNGGCGVRPFMDLWVMQRSMPCDEAALQSLLQAGGLAAFYAFAKRLCNVWFGDAPADELTQEVEQFLLRGGLYGTEDNRISVAQGKTGGKLRYIMRRIVLPYHELKFYYPVLQRHPILTPLCQVRRWGRLIFCGGMGRSARELSASTQMSRSQVERTAYMLSQIGL